MDHSIATRPGIGMTATILQSQPLRFSRVTNSEPVLVVVKFGRKVLHAPGFTCTLEPGDAVAIAQDQTIDIINTPGLDGQYQADWLVWEPSLIGDYASQSAQSRNIELAQPLLGMTEAFTGAVDRALAAVRHKDEVPDAIARHRLMEVLAWIDILGGHFVMRAPKNTTAVVRRMISSSLDANWTVSSVAAKVAMSESTLRRRLADDGTTLGQLIADTRMSYAMQLLQSTDFPVSRIALEVGYDSASRFAIRFRHRFGFSPSAIRGHRRGETKRLWEKGAVSSG